MSEQFLCSTDAVSKLRQQIAEAQDLRQKWQQTSDQCSGQVRQGVGGCLMIVTLTHSHTH